MAMSLLKKKSPAIPPALLPIERQPEFASLLGKREELRMRLKDCEAEHVSASASLVPAKIYAEDIEQLIENPAMDLEDHQAHHRRARLGELDREMKLLRLALYGIERQLVQTRGRLSGEVRQAQAPLYRLDVRKALEAALRLRLIEGQRSARLSRLTGHGYHVGGLTTVVFAQPWGALGDCQSHWRTVLRELREDGMITPEEFTEITAGTIPDSLTRP